MAQVLDHIRAVHHTRETIYAIYVVDPASGRLLQTVTLRRIITAAPDCLVVTLGSGRRC